MTNKDLQKKEDFTTPILSYSEKMSKLKVICKDGCKLCQSKLRAEAEAEYDKNNNIRAAFKFLEDKGEKISYPAVRNHIFNHYLKQERNIKLDEYSESLEIWLGQKTTRKQSLLERIAIFNNELAIIASETEGLNLEERRKSADALKKISDTITSMEDKIAEMEQQMEPVVLVITQFQNIISRRIKGTSNQEVKSELSLLLDDLKEELGDLSIPKQEN